MRCSLVRTFARNFGPTFVVAALALVGATSSLAEPPVPPVAPAVDATPAPPVAPAPPVVVPPAAVALPVVTLDQGADAFLDVYRVLLHPRCMNCHPNGERPLQTDNSVPHMMNIQRQSFEVGLPCSACHRETMPTERHQPPGLLGWRMPPKSIPMVFEGRTPAQLCAQLKTPRETAGRNLTALLHHVEHDALVHYGWNAGPGRGAPPMSHEAFVLAFSTWVRAGGPCPAPDVRVDVKRSAQATSAAR